MVLELELRVADSTENKIHVDFLLSGEKIGFADLLLRALQSQETDKTIIFEGFYPHFYDKTPKRNQIGAIALRETLLELIKQERIDTEYIVLHHPKRTLEYSRFLKRIGLRDGQDVSEYLIRLNMYLEKKEAD